MLGCTVLSSLISPSEHTASSHTSTVKCGCFNHRRESLILLRNHREPIAFRPELVPEALGDAQYNFQLLSYEALRDTSQF